MNVNVTRNGKIHTVNFKINGKMVSLEIPKGKTSRKEVRKIVEQYARMGDR